MAQEKGQLKAALVGALEQKAGLEASLTAAHEEQLRVQHEVRSRPSCLPGQARHAAGHEPALKQPALHVCPRRGPFGKGKQQASAEH